MALIDPTWEMQRLKVRWNLTWKIPTAHHGLCAGFTTDIGATPDDLNLAVSLFFITFVLLQPPSAAVGRWLSAKRWITIIMASPTTSTV